MVSKPSPKKPELIVDLPKLPNEKHLALLRDKTSLGDFAYAFGVRLLDLQHGAWREVTYGGPYEDWTSYLNKGVGMCEAQARKHLAIAQMPAWVVRQHGVEKAAILYKITELTQVDETPEEAVALILPLLGGGTKPFEEMTSDEVNNAYRLIRMGEAEVKRRAAAARSLEATADLLTGADGIRLARLQSTAVSAVEEWLKPKQVRVRERGGKAYLDLSSIPEENAIEIFEKLIQVLREQK